MGKKLSFYKVSQQRVLVSETALKQREIKKN